MKRIALLTLSLTFLSSASAQAQSGQSDNVVTFSPAQLVQLAEMNLQARTLQAVETNKITADVYATTETVVVSKTCIPTQHLCQVTEATYRRFYNESGAEITTLTLIKTQKKELKAE